MKLASILKTDKQRLLLLEFTTLLLLTVLTLWSVRPLLEEWGLFGAFDANGIAYLQHFAEVIPLRPFHLVPAAISWELLGGRTTGVAAGTLLLMLLRYAVMRWAVTPLFQGRERWIVATMAAVLIAWPGAWLGRFAPAQFSALMFFVAFGCAIRLHRQWSLPAALGCIVSVLLLLTTYQALALCLVALPLYALMWARRTSSTPSLGVIAARAPELRVALTIAFAFVLYGVYAMSVTRGGGGGYEAELAQSSTRLLTVAGLSAHIGGVYLTAFGGTALVMPLFLLLAFSLQPERGSPAQASPGKQLAPLAILALVAVVPLFSVIYLNAGHITDPDRIMFPASVALVVTAVSIIAWSKPENVGANTGTIMRLHAVVIVAILMLTGAVAAWDAKKFANIQRQVIKQVIPAIDAHNARSLLIVDTTGTLGDIYTLVNPTLTQALAVYKRQVEATICTPDTIDRFHPVARRYPVSTTPRCNEVSPQAAPVLVLVAREENGAIILRP